MPSTYTSRFRLEKIGNGEKSGSWGTTENGTRDLLEIAIAGYLEIAMADANVTLTTANGSTDQARYHILKMTGTNTATRDVIAPALSRTYVIENGTTQSIRIKTSTGVAVTIPTGLTAFVYCDGTDFALASAYSTTNIDILNSVTPAADRLLYFTSSSAGALATITSFGRSLIDDADASTSRTTLGLGSLATASSINDSNWSGTDLAIANGGTGSSTASDARTALGLAIGSNVQAYNANLAQVAGLSIVADTLPYGNGTGTLALTTLSTFARTLLDDADAAAARATLGITDGGTALQAANNLSDVPSPSIARTNLGLAIGTNVQAYSSNLANWSAVAPSSYAAVANNLSDLASASTARTNLGLGTAAVVNTGTSGATIPLLNGANTWGAEQRIIGPYIGGNASSYRGISDTSGVYAAAGAILVWGGSGDEHTYLSARTGSTVIVRANGLSGTDLTVSASALTWGGVAIPTISSTSTLSNKTLSSPTLSGTVAGSPAASGQWQWSGGNDAAYWHGILLAPTDAGTNKPSLYITHAGPSSYAIGLYDGTDTDGTIQFNCGTLNHNGQAITTDSATRTLSNKTLSSPTLSGTVAGSPTFSGNLTISSTSVPLVINSSNNAYVLGISYASATGGYVGSTGAGNLRLTDSTIATTLDINTAKVLATGTLQAQKTTSAATPGTTSNSITNVIFRVAGSNVGAAGYGIDVGVSNSDGSSWIQSRDHNDYATNTTLKLNPNGGAVTIGGTVTVPNNVSFRVTGTGADVRNAVKMTTGDVIEFSTTNNLVTWNGFDHTWVTPAGNSMNLSNTGAFTIGGVAVPTISSTDTLSNKTLSSPTFSGTVAGTPTISSAWTWSTAQTFPHQTKIGSGSGQVYQFIDGGASGTNGGAALVIQLGGASTIAIGNKSSIIGGAYDSTSLYYNAATTEFYASGNNVWSYTVSGIFIGGVAVPTISSTNIITNKQIRTPISSETSGSLTSASANKSVACTGGVTLANSTFTAGDMIVLDPGTSSRTITRGSGVTMYANGTDVASATLAANKMGGVFWRSASVCVLSGAIS